MTVNARLGEITERIRNRSRDDRNRYLDRMAAAIGEGPRRARLGCANLAHGFAACGPEAKARLAGGGAPNIGVVTAYNDMLSAHRPYERYPALIRAEAERLGATAQVAGGVPAMCDGVTQGEPGMELSLFSRDVIAMATGVALSHTMFDAALMLGICDKIVPGLVIGALAFGHLPTIFVPSGPMPTGLSNGEKNRVRQLYAEGKATRADLLEAESRSYHAAGTCTFYGTANTNQMLMEFMGLHLPGASFVPPDTPLRDALTRAAVARVLAIGPKGESFRPIGEVLDERAFVNGIVGLMATGGSTNLTLHLVAMARAAGLCLTWDDFADLSAITPLLARAYPNGAADVNAFRDAGGVPFVIRELLAEGLLHPDAKIVWGDDIAAQAQTPALDAAGELVFDPVATVSPDETVVRPAARPFQATGGLELLTGNLGRAVIKSSAVAPERRVIEAPARVFASQDEVQRAFKAGELTGDFVAVVRFQGPRANGMPELHKLTPPLGVLQDRGQKVALVTDGRMSGASGKVPAAIHLTPEAADGGPIARLRDGDVVRLDAVTGRLEVLIDPAEWATRPAAVADLQANQWGVGRELFATFRRAVGPAEQGASSL
ncbi:phosphogluconate dehydratase [Pinisolibacter aquiterrae]|uniref:phosphogluconate dehydratase n=1 Tax=Pinisolibacter aquiterrae TaxID=2815579 RepID=UPI001C3CD054|nr:phosphogluconate dehydratase [Pinisolibacter aquiterrae]MBV5265647.1 phosphogluconate dehydratase [Pinisolibacter aquiterrae]MCC8236788.1 phosphogluconate dehydratase [Pinisolibacter aquiterrae]